MYTADGQDLRFLKTLTPVSSTRLRAGISRRAREHNGVIRARVEYIINLSSVNKTSKYRLEGKMPNIISELSIDV
jgi:hypothetical protein